MLGPPPDVIVVLQAAAANCAEAAANDPDGLSLVRVGTLGDALTALDALRANKPVVGC